MNWDDWTEYFPIMQEQELSFYSLPAEIRDMPLNYTNQFEDQT